MNKSRSVPIVIVKCRDYTHVRHVIKRLLYPNPGIRTFDFFSLFLFDRSSSLSLYYIIRNYIIYTPQIYIFISLTLSKLVARSRRMEREQIIRTQTYHTNIDI